MNRKVMKEAEEKLQAELVKQGLKPAVEVTDAKENRGKKKKPIFKTVQMLPPDLINFTIRAEVEATKLGLQTEDKVLWFNEVNASEVVDVAGFHLRPELNDDNSVAKVAWDKANIKVPLNSPIYPFLKMEGIQVCRITGDAILKSAIYKRAASQLFLGRGKYLLGNMKSEDSILAVLTRDQAQELLGSDIGDYDNPFKPWLAAFGTPTRLVYAGDPEVIRIRVIDDLKTDEGHKYHDGTLITRFSVVYRRYKKRLAGQTDEEYEATRKTRIIKSSHQDRIFGRVGDTMFPAVKCKGYHDRVKYMQLCMEFGFNPFEADAIMTLGNIKTKNHDYKHGDIMEVPAEIFRIIGVSSRSGRSSVGGQAMCLDLDTITKLFKEKGMADRAKIFKKACLGDAKSLVDIILGQEEHSSFEDVTIMWIINALYAIKREDGSWGWPRFLSNYNNVCVRLNRYFIDNVIKCRLSSVALYLEVNPLLDQLEMQHFRRTGNHINLVMLPNSSKIRKMMVGSKTEPAEFKYLNIGRNPIVSQGNLQGVEMLREETGAVVYNDSNDTIEISAAFASEMFGDQDGDKVIFCPSNEAHFPVYRSTLPEEVKKVKAAPVQKSDKDLALDVINAAVFICEAAMDTGVLDFTRRQIYIEAWLQGKPITPQEGKEIGDICENAIQRIKHVKERGGSQADEINEEMTVRDMLIKKYARGGQIAPARMAPREFTITKRFVDRRGYNESTILNRKLELINSSVFHPQFPFNVAFDEVKGAELSVDHGHSEKIRMMFEPYWIKLRGHLHNNRDYTFTVKQVMDEGDYINNHYRASSKKALELQDPEARTEAFKAMRVRIRNYLDSLKRALGDEMGSKFLHYLVIYMGSKGFGTILSHGQTYSRSGLGLRMFPEELLIWAARQVNPENPWCMQGGDLRAERMIENLKKKRASQVHVDEA